MKIFPDVRNSGSGITGDSYRQGGIRGFFGVFFRKTWKLFLLNMLFMLFFVPGAVGIVMYKLGIIPIVLAAVLVLFSVVTAGPAAGGMFKILRAFTLEEPVFMAHTFFKTFKNDFKKNTFWGIINFLVAAAMYSAVKIYPLAFKSQGPKYFFIGITAFVCISVIIMDFYYFHLSTSTNLEFKDVLKDSFFFVSLGLKTNIIVLIANLVIILLVALLCYFIKLWEIFFFLPASLNGLIITFWCYPYIRKYVINPYYQQTGEVNPEMEYEESKQKAVFKDMGGKEKPIKFDTVENKKHARVKGKDIS